MKRTKRQNKEILNVVEIAKEYVKQGENFINAIKKAQDEIEKEEREKYEGNGC